MTSKNKKPQTKIDWVLVRLTRKDIDYLIEGMEGTMNNMLSGLTPPSQVEMDTIGVITGKLYTALELIEGN